MRSLTRPNNFVQRWLALRAFVRQHRGSSTEDLSRHLRRAETRATFFCAGRSTTVSRSCAMDLHRTPRGHRLHSRLESWSPASYLSRPGFDQPETMGLFRFWWVMLPRRRDLTSASVCPRPVRKLRHWLKRCELRQHRPRVSGLQCDSSAP